MNISIQVRISGAKIALDQLLVLMGVFLSEDKIIVGRDEPVTFFEPWSLSWPGFIWIVSGLPLAGAGPPLPLP